MVQSDLKPRQILALTRDKTAMVFGPGLGTKDADNWAKMLYRLLIDLPIPKVVDADALRLLSKDLNEDLSEDLSEDSSKDLNEDLSEDLSKDLSKDSFSQATKKSLQNAIFTPHPSEAAGLLNVSTAEIQHSQVHREKAILNLHARGLGTVVLKGRNTLVATQKQSGQFLSLSLGESGLSYCRDGRTC